jgi:CrcB protein
MAIGLALPDAGLPWAVLLANVLGALLIGILTARLPSPEVRVFLGTGVLGAGCVLVGLSAAAFGLRVGRPGERAR